MNQVSRALAAWRVFNERRRATGWQASLKLRRIDKLAARKKIGKEWPRITINPARAQHELLMRTGNSSDYRVAEQVFKDRNYATIEALPNVRKMIDCGANVGYTSACLLSHHPAASVIAVEPDQENWLLCQRNLKSYGDRATVLRAAVWGSDRKLAVTSGGSPLEWARQVSEAPGSNHDDIVEGMTMRRLMELSGGVVDIVKMDIEWAELDIFKADTSWLASVRNLAIELHDDECRRVFFKAMNQWNFDLELTNELTLCLNIRPR
jgi:FkbM family methyltransferase